MARKPKDLIARAGRGDDGTTGLLGGGRVPKDDPQIEAYGTVDEASSAIGFAKALTEHDRVRELCAELQHGLYMLSADLATNPSKESRFAVTEEQVERLDALCEEVQAEIEPPTGFVLPGTVPASGQLDVARAVVRRAERRVTALRGERYTNARRWLNRLSLLLFLLARYEEDLAQVRAQPADARS